MSKKVSQLFFILLILILGSISFVIDANADMYDIYTYTVANGQVTITKCSPNASGEITIPSTLGGNSVTRIGDGAFSNCNRLTSLTIPDSVTSIGSGAFSACSSLTEITLPFIGSSALANGTSDAVLGHIFGNSVGNLVKQFYSSTASYTYTIPQSLKKVTITNATQIPYGAFSNCSGLTDITIPDNVINIGDMAFYNCSGLSNVTMPDGVTSIGRSVFAGCSSLTNIIIPDNVTSIGDMAFYNCSGLSNVTMPDGVTSIGSSVFSGCNSLISLTIPNGVTSIVNSAFNNCYSLISLTVFDSTKFSSSEFNNCSDYLTLKILKNTGTILNEFCIASKVPKVVIESGITAIGEGAFSYCTSLTTIMIPSTVESIGYHAFEGTPWLTNYPTEFIIVGQDLLVKWNRNKESVQIPSNVKKIVAGAFESCDLLADIEISPTIKEINKLAFKGCKLLQSIIIPPSVTFIGEYAFYNCPYLTISGYENSVAETYATDYYIPFKLLDNATLIPLTASTASIIDNNIVLNISSNISFTNQFVHMALYDSSKKMIDYIILPVTELSDKFYVVIKNNPAVSYAKIFVWENSGNIQPIANYETVYIQ